MPSRNIDDLAPALQPICREFMKRCSQAGLDILITCTWRSNGEQDQLYAQGRTRPGPIVTYCKGGQSAHNHVDHAGNPCAMAFDVVPMRYGKCAWAKSDPMWQVAGKIGEELGLNWYGRKGSPFTEFPHFQLGNGK